MVHRTGERVLRMGILVALLTAIEIVSFAGAVTVLYIVKFVKEPSDED